MEGIIFAHLGATWFMAGLIWFVQIVHYPMFANVPSSGYAAYQAVHLQRTTWVVGPPMLVEAGTCVWLGTTPLAQHGLYWESVGLLLVVWVSTAVFSVPNHGKLAEGFDAKVHRTLVSTNWIRTIAWTTRAAVVALLIQAS